MPGDGMHIGDTEKSAQGDLQGDEHESSSGLSGAYGCFSK
jgi:hypothetical protein